MTREEEFTKLWRRGIKLIEDGRESEAEPIINRAASEFPDLWCSKATDISRNGKEQLGIVLAHKVLDLCKNNVSRALAKNTVGLILANRGQAKEGLEYFREAHQLCPDKHEIMTNIALACRWLGQTEDAEQWLKRALEKNPWFHDAEFERSLIALLKGDYKTGFELYECRWRSKNNGLQKVEAYVPEWDGTNGKRLFVYSEQGAGDAILMMRYAKPLKERGLWLAWAFQKSMVPLAESLGLIDCVLGPTTTGDQLPEFDCHIPAFSLPRIFGTTLETIPPTPYIPRPNVIPHYGPGFHVGICWRGSTGQKNDYLRSTCLDSWLPVFEVEGVTFHSLQVDGADEALLYPKLNRFEPPKDWMDTARRVGGMDLIISVDTSMVHLAGAMGVPCWCAMHCRPYFVYPLVCEHTPWYPSVRLFKQKESGDWTPVFERIAYELKLHIAAA
jgi:hypothetical protein